MKIGAFAKTHGVSIDTVRHYMELNLLIPIKEGAHYQFDERCGRDMGRIARLKGAGFSLAEIKSIMAFMRIGTMTDYQQDEIYRSMFTARLARLEAQIGELETVRNELRRSIESMETGPADPLRDIGIPLDALDLFACSACGGALTLSRGQIVDGQILSGELSCGCGQTYPIEDGILNSPGNIPSQTGYNYIEQISDYILATPTEYIDRLYTSIEWGVRSFRSLDQKGRTALDLGSGMGIFLRNFYEWMDPSLTYITVDRDLQLHRFLKEILRSAPQRKRLIFIAGDFSVLPLKESCIDLVIDGAGSSNYAFEHDRFLLGEVRRFLKPQADLLSGLLMFEAFAGGSQIPPDRRWLFTPGPILEAIRKLGFTVESQHETQRASEGGQYEDFFVEGERVYTLLVKAKRWG